MDLRKVLATLGILAFVWPAAFLVALTRSSWLVTTWTFWRGMAH